ncbi:methyltransferase domain-containing protein [Pseudoalteromonas fenneropenaei]|uniref:Methyltransferase domain-containing protein n=1 Tax=Pseudoalteromonas fenneropenaei TaxID=1737459 RepID=A0ABV7CFE6_9GAMM
MTAFSPATDAVSRHTKTITAAKFGAAASLYQQHARVQATAAAMLFSLMQRHQGQQAASWGLDLGCGPGHHSVALQRYFSPLLQLDLSHTMLMQSDATSSKVCADMDALPLQDGSVDGIFSNFAMQWSQNLPALINALYRVLTPGSNAYLSLVLDGSLQEIISAYHQASLPCKVNQFITELELRNIVASTAFHTLSFNRVTLVDQFDTAKQALQSIKHIGATHSINSISHTGLGGKGKLKQVLDCYPQLSGRATVSYQVALIALHKPIC